MWKKYLKEVWWQKFYNGKSKVDNLLAQYPTLQGFYWAKEKIRELYRQKDREEAAKLLDNIIFNLKIADDAELVRWGNTLKKWREPNPP